MSRRVHIRVPGIKVGLLAELAEAVVQEMRAEGREGVSFNLTESCFVSEGEAEGYSDHYENVARASHKQDVTEAESRYGLKLRELRENQVKENAEKCGYDVKKRVEEDGKVKMVLRQRVYS